MKPFRDLTTTILVIILCTAMMRGQGIPAEGGSRPGATVSAVLAPSKVVFVQQPSNSLGGATISPAVTVQLQDKAGANVPQSGVSIVMALSSGTGALTGTTTRQTNAQGLASFDDLSIDLIGSKRLTASSSSLQSATSNSFTVSLGPAARLEIGTQPSTTATAGVAFGRQPVVWVEDRGGNRLTGDNSTVVTAVRLEGNGTLQGGVTVTALKGVVTFANLSHNVANTITIRFTSGSLTPDTSTGILVSAAAVARLAFSSQPTAAVAGATIVPPVTVKLQDAFGNDVARSGTAITIALTSGTGTLSGTLTRSTTSGIAAFNDLSINLAGAKVLTASSGTLTAAVSGTFIVSPDAPKSLAFVQQPTNAVAATAISPPVKVQLRDALGNNAAASGVPVTLSISSGTGSLSGMATQSTDATGLATFSGLSINLSGSKTLSASAPGLASATSSAFSITPGAATQLAFVQQPTNAAAGAAIAPAVTVQLKDAQGNLVRTAGVSVSIVLSSGTGILTGTVPQLTDAAGLATFNNLSINLAGPKGFTASAVGLTSAVSTSFTIVAAPANKLDFTTNPAGGTAGSPFPVQPVLTLKDVFGNVVTGVAQTVTLAIRDNAGPGGTLSGSKSANVDLATGQAVFSGLSIDKAGVGYTLTATGSSVSTAAGTVVSTPFTIVAGAANKVRVENASDGKGTVLGSQTVTSGTSVLVYAIARDAFDNFAGLIPAGVWALQNTTGGVVPADLIPSADRRSATFTARGVGTCVITVSVAGLGSVPSGTLTVVMAGSASKVRVETAPNGTGTVVPAQDIAAGSSISLFAIARDGADNFVSNIAADSWALQNRTGGVASGDLVASADRKSATFTGKLIGTAEVRALAGSLAPTNSGVLSVIAGLPTTVAATSGTPQTTNVGTTFPLRLSALVRDAAGNPVKAILVTWSAPVSGASGSFAPGGSAAMTDTNGIATSGAFRANTVVGSYVVVGAIPGVTPTAAYALTNTFGRAASITTVAGSPQSAQVNSQFLISLAVSVRDSAGNAVGDLAVTFQAPASGPSGTFPGGVQSVTLSTNSSGIATAPVLTANSIAGNYQVTATAPGVPSAAVFALVNIGGSVGGITATAGTPQGTTVAADFPVRLEAVVDDASGNRLNGVLVTFTAPATGPSGSFAKGIVDSTLTDAAGVAVASTLTANSSAGPFTVLARAAGVATPASYVLTNLPGPVDTFLIDAAGGGSIGTQVTRAPFNIRLVANDRHGNAATQFTGTVDISSNGVISQAGGTTAPFTSGVLSSHTVAMQSAGRFVIMAMRTGGAETGRSDTFLVVNPAPTVTRFSPSTGRRGQTLDVVFTGSGFIPGATTVSFGDQISTLTTINAPTQLVVTISIDTAAVEGPRDVNVFNVPPGGGSVTLTGAFIVGSNPVPTLAMLTPARAHVLQRLNVVFSGSNFASGVSRIEMGPGILINEATIDSATRMTADISITGAAEKGIRKVVVINSPPGGGVSDSVAFFVDAPQTPYPEPVWPADNEVLVDTTVTIRWHPWPISGILYRLQIATSPSFSTVIFEDSTIADTVRQVGGLVRGQTYSWRVFARASVGMSQPSPARAFTTSPLYPTTYALLDTVDYPSYPNNGMYQSTDYRLVGLPGNSNASVSSLMTGANGADWVAYWENGAENDYLVQFDGGSTFNFSPGRAFWVLHRGKIVIRTTVPTAALDSGKSVSIPVHRGFNLITNPYLHAVSWSAVQGASVPDTLGSLWTFDGSFSTTPILMPYSGYLFDYRGNRGSLRIPLAGFTAKGSVPADALLWRIRIELISGKFIDRATSIGVSPIALEGRDLLDERMPRGVGAIPGVFFSRPAWDPPNGVFATDIRPDIDIVESWPMDVRVTAWQPARLSFSGVGAVPSNYRVVLIDDDRARSADLRSDPVYRFTPGAPVSHFRIVVGKEDAVRAVLNNLLPTEFALGNNFPNPFNPSTTIRYGLPYQSQVSLTVYNTLGQQISVLQNGEQEAGYHEVKFDARLPGLPAGQAGGQGSNIASGVYFYRMQAGGFVATKKFLLLK